jgi:hypothetical protein
MPDARRRRSTTHAIFGMCSLRAGSDVGYAGSVADNAIDDHMHAIDVSSSANSVISDAFSENSRANGVIYRVNSVIDRVVDV